MILEILLAAHLKLGFVVKDHSLAMTFTVDSCPEHASLAVDGSNENQSRSSSFLLRPDQRQYPVDWRNIGSGEWMIWATLINQDGKIGADLKKSFFIP